nr:hypothetical protein Iba_chr02cCG14870 [Ipomoea batatas]
MAVWHYGYKREGNILGNNECRTKNGHLLCDVSICVGRVVDYWGPRFQSRDLTAMVALRLRLIGGSTHTLLDGPHFTADRYHWILGDRGLVISIFLSPMVSH